MVLVPSSKEMVETVPVTEIVSFRRRKGVPTAGQLHRAKPAPAAGASNDIDKSDDTFDIVVIGGGHTGYVAALFTS